MQKVEGLTVSPKQMEMIKVLEDKEHTEIFMGGAAGGCGVGNTRTSTIHGEQFLKDLKKGDIVLTFNHKKNKLEYNPILETFINGGSVECIRVKLKNGKEIKFTSDHKFLFNGEWIKIRELARRGMEENRQGWDIFDKQQRKIKNKQLEEFWKDYDYETCNNKERISTYGYNFKRKKECSSNSQISRSSVHSKLRKQTTSESQGFKQEKQSGGKFGMDDKQGELPSRGEERINGRIYGERRNESKSTNKAREPERNEQTNRATSPGDTSEIHPEKIWKEEIGNRVRSKTKYYQGYYNEKKLEAREIDFNEIVEIEFYWQNELMYDIETKNSSYVLGNGIIVHNSKSFTGCLWQIMRRLTYPRSRGFLARARLKSLKESTLLTFFEVCRMMGLRQNIDFTYNAITGVIKFSNGSEEYLKDLFLYPSDPDFVSLGSTEFTDGFIDEMAEITEQAYQIMRSRMRFKLDEFGLIPKIAMGSNPCKTFIYKEFYKKWRDDELEPYKAYVRASVYDNPFISEHYIENLKKLDPINKARLLEGNWEYDDDPLKLFDYDKIIDLFTNEAERGNRYASVDQAGFGRDRCIITIWDGLFVIHAESKDNISSKELDLLLKKWRVPRSNCVVDEGGVGFGLVKDIPELVGFVSNATALKKKKELEEEKSIHNYNNLRSQCWFLLSKYVNSGLIGIYEKLPIEIKNLLVEDLEQMKQVDADKDTPLRVISKKELKELGSLTRSTDAGDSWMMRMYFEINPNESSWFFAGGEEKKKEFAGKEYAYDEIHTEIIDGKNVKMVGDRQLVE